MSQYTMNAELDVVIAAVADDVCRHCGNARNDGTPAPELCTECGRCYGGASRCQCSPNCVVRDVDNYGGAEDTGRATPPTVVSQSPLADTEGSDPRAVNSTISATLNKDVDASTVSPSTVFLVDEDGNPCAPYAASAPTVVDETITLHLTGNLEYTTVYSIRITEGVKDVDGMTLGEVWTGDPWTTRSSDAVLPTIVSVTPANAATGVAADTDVVVTFSEAMNIAGITVALGTIFIEAVDGGTGGEFDETITWSAGNTVATLTLFTTLQAAKTYKVHVTTDAHDANGNALAVEYAQAAGFTVAP